MRGRPFSHQKPRDEKESLQQNSYVLNQLLNYSLERGKIHMHELDADFLEKFIVAASLTLN